MALLAGATSPRTPSALARDQSEHRLLQETRPGTVIGNLSPGLRVARRPDAGCCTARYDHSPRAGCRGSREGRPGAHSQGWLPGVRSLHLSRSTEAGLNEKGAVSPLRGLDRPARLEFALLRRRLGERKAERRKLRPRDLAVELGGSEWKPGSSSPRASRCAASACTEKERSMISTGWPSPPAMFAGGPRRARRRAAPSGELVLGHAGADLLARASASIATSCSWWPPFARGRHPSGAECLGRDAVDRARRGDQHVRVRHACSSEATRWPSMCASSAARDRPRRP